MTMRKLGGLVSALVIAAACGGPLKYHARSTDNAPGADAEIEADVNPDQRLTQLTVQIVNLPPPDRVEPSGRHFVAWYRTSPSAVWIRVGALAYDADTREAMLTSSVPEQRFELEITVEPSINVASPSPNVVLVQGIGG